MNKTNVVDPVQRFGMRFEFKIEDSWIGVFWKRSKDEEVEVSDDERSAVMVTTPRLDIWICFVPWFPLHIVKRGKSERSAAMKYISGRHMDEIAKEHLWDLETMKKARFDCWNRGKP